MSPLHWPWFLTIYSVIEFTTLTGKLVHRILNTTQNNSKIGMKFAKHLENSHRANGPILIYEWQAIGNWKWCAAKFNWKSNRCIFSSISISEALIQSAKFSNFFIQKEIAKANLISVTLQRDINDWQWNLGENLVIASLLHDGNRKWSQLGRFVDACVLLCAMGI